MFILSVRLWATLVLYLSALWSALEDGFQGLVFDFQAQKLAVSGLGSPFGEKGESCISAAAPTTLQSCSGHGQSCERHVCGSSGGSCCRHSENETAN